MNFFRTKIVTTAALFALIGLPAQAQPSKGVVRPLQPFVENHTIAGAVVLVADMDKVLDVETVGYADLAAKQPIQPDNLFWIASMTKPITATAVLMLQDEGRLSVDDPVEKYLPELAGLKTADGKPARLTLRHLLTHTSGMAEATPQESRAATALADLIPHYAEKPLQFEPGTKWQYCQSGINSLGRIVEVVSGQAFPEFLQKRLFAPLGMKDTTFYPTREQIARLAKSYKAENDRLEEATIFILDGHNPHPANGIQPPTAVCSRRPPITAASAGCSSTGVRSTAGNTSSPKGQAYDHDPNRRPEDRLHRRQRLGPGLLRRAAAARGHRRAVARHVRTRRRLWDAGLDRPGETSGLCANGPAVELSQLRCLGRATGVPRGGARAEVRRWPRVGKASRVPPCTTAKLVGLAFARPTLRLK